MRPEGSSASEICSANPSFGPGDGPPGVEAGKIRAPASFARVGDVTKDAREVAQAVLPPLERLRRRYQFTHRHIVQGGKRLVQMPLGRKGTVTPRRPSATYTFTRAESSPLSAPR
jgi:hypothetical protein